MPLHTSTRPRNILFTGVALLLGSHLFLSGADNTAQPGTNAEWDALIRETEELIDWVNNPGADLGLDDDTETGLPSTLTWSVRMAGGGGYSDNFLKREEPVSSRFSQLEGDFLLSALFNRSTLAVLLYVQDIRYDRDVETDSETVAFLHSSWVRANGAWNFGSEFTAYYGDEIYDASLAQDGIPAGERLRQFRPELTLYAERFIGERDSLRADLRLRRPLFEDETDDYWGPGASVEWRHLWSAGLESTSRAIYYAEVYDEDVARSRIGLPLQPEDRLVIHAFGIEQELIWQPAGWEWLRARAQAGIVRESEGDGDFEAQDRFWAGLRSSMDFQWIRLDLGARWLAIHYDQRQAGFSDPRPQHQVFRSYKAEAEFPLPWNMAFKTGAEWTDFNSRFSSEQFAEKRVFALLNWSY